MKNTLSLLTAVLMALSSLPATAQLQEENRTVWFEVGAKESPLLIEPGKPYAQTVIIAKKEYSVRRFLRVVGGIQMPGKFKKRGETLFREAEYLIDDHLDSLNRYKDPYSLYFTGKNDAYEHHAYNRVSLPTIQPGKLTVEVPVKRNKLKVSPEGDFGVELQVYFQKEGRHTDEVYDTPDTTLYLPVPAGSGGFRLLKKEFDLPENIATILVRIGGTNFSGACWVEAPRFYQSGKEVWHAPFTFDEKRESDYNYWVGINMVSRSWPLWKLEFKGKTLFEGNIFDRASDIADFYIPLPEGIEGEGELKLSLLKEANKAVFPYELRSLQLMEESARDFEIVSVPRYPAVGDTAGILIETNKPGITLTVEAPKEVTLLTTELTFEKPGLHAISFSPVSPGEKIPFVITDGKEKRTAHIQQSIIKDKDKVYLSSGDEVHIDNVYTPYNYYFKWYIRERIGNWYHIRPSYQWSGVRITTEEFARHYTGLLNRLHMPYAWQVEGRTLAATRINPSLEALASPMFRGKQAHENDGGYYYWQHFHYNGLHSDMAARTRPYGGIFAKHRPIYTDHGIFIHYDPYGVKDMADGAQKLIANLNYSRGESTRHTGPSTAFRYLYQAGYDWLGAEQMYGPEDIIMSALRGASRAYGKTEYGSLHAVQWGSHPFTDPKHALRFYNSLAVAYMHGSSHINTEEGLWTDEYANDRFTEAGKRHTYAQHQILDFIETHSRKGDLHTPIAVVHGRNDSWKSFGRQYSWSQKEEKWKFGAALESFDLLKVFYPEAIVDGCGPKGWFTSTPYGAVDILPIEAGNEVMQQYKLLVFLGWNTFSNADFVRLHKFVEQGGTLLLTAAHVNSELQPDQPVQFPEDDTVVKKLLGLDYKTYTEKREINIGKGKVIYYPYKGYPVEEAIREDYVAEMNRLAAEAITGETAKGWIKATPHIDFTVWDACCLRTIYVLNIDWQSESATQPATFLLNDYAFTFDVARYHTATIRSKANIAALPGANTSDILSIIEEDNQWIITCQTTGDDSLLLMNGTNGKETIEKISGAGIHKITLRK